MIGQSMAGEALQLSTGDGVPAVQLRTGASVPAICFGGGARIKDGDVFERALRTGYRFLDTAVVYGNDHLLFSSEFGRRLLAEQRESVVVCSKVQTWDPLPDSVSDALGRMELEYLDLLLIHHPMHPKDEDPLATLQRTWKAMEQLVDDGVVRMIGVSNTGCSLLEYLLDFCRIPPVVNQIEFHPYAQDRDVLAACEESGIRVEAYCPLGSPWRQAKRGIEPPTTDPVIAEIARAKARAPAQVILRWHLDKGVIPVVSGTRPEHMQQNLDVSGFELDRSEREAIDGLDRRDRLWRDQVKLACMLGTVTDGTVVVPRRWPKPQKRWAKPQATVVVQDAVTSTEGALRLAALPLGLVGELPIESILEVLRTRLGPQPLDYLILEQPVSLSDDWRSNNVDHASKLVSAWDAMGSLVQRGATRALGIAHAGEAVIDLLLERASVPPALNQIEFHPYLNSASLVSYCRDRGVAVHALRSLGPSDGPEPLLLRDPAVTELARAHDRAPAEIVLNWCLSRVDGVVLDSAERVLVSSPKGLSDFELSPDELASLDDLHSAHRIDRSPSTLASIYGSLAAEPMQVRPVDTDQLEVGCHKVLYAPVTRSESFNRRFSFFVWRDLFNLPATTKHALRPLRQSPLSKRIAADLDRDGYALTNVDELGCEESFRRLAAKSSGLIGTRQRMKHGRRDFDLGEEIEVPTALQAAIDSYFGLETFIDAKYIVTSPGLVGIYGLPRRQQLWHSDSEDLITIKVYTFLTDVDAFSGALEYIAESHPKGRFAVRVAELWKRSFVKDPTPDHNTQVPDDLLFRHVRPDLLRRLEGPAGTVVVFDARGLHRGGHVLRGTRQVAISSYTAPMDAHGRRPPASRWSSLWSRFQWQTNVNLREPDANGASPKDRASRV